MDKPIKYKYLRLFIYSIFWAIFWLSINTMPFEIYLFGESFVKSLNSLRLLSALVVSLLLFLILIYNFFFKNFKLALKKDNLKILFLLLFLTYSFSFALDNSRNFNLDNLYLIILSLGTIFVYFLIKFEKEEQFKNFIKINIFFLCIICIVIVTPKIDQLIINNFNFYYAFAPLDGNILDQVNPRITGLSRTFAILSIFLFVIFINLKNKYLKFFLFFYFFNYKFSYTFYAVKRYNFMFLCFYFFLDIVYR